MANLNRNNNRRSSNSNNNRSISSNRREANSTNILDYNSFFGLLCGGCIAASKTSKTAPHNDNNNKPTNNTSRYFHVRCGEQQPHLMRNDNKKITNKNHSSTVHKSSHMMMMIVMMTMIVLMAGIRSAKAAPLTTDRGMQRNTTSTTAAAAATATKTAAARDTSTATSTTGATSTATTKTTATATATVLRTVVRTALHKTPNSMRNNNSTSNITIVQHHTNNNNNNNRTTSRLHKRHSKRHSNWYDYVNYNENSTILEWANPCGGFYDPTQVVGVDFRGMKRIRNKEIFNILKRSVGNEFKTLNGSHQEIDISNIQLWSLYEYTYKFLPKLKMNSSIALRRWYRNTQTYVASFAYLRRIQLKWDHTKRQRESRVASELKHLLFSSRSMLCELETAINSTQPHRRRIQLHQQQQQQPNLYIFNRQQMNKRLKLRTKRRNERSPDALHEADSIDLQYVKLYYYEFLETMWKVLRKNMKRRGQIALRDNRKEFNEVAKRFGSIAADSSDSSSSRGQKELKQQRRRNRDKSGRRGTKQQQQRQRQRKQQQKQRQQRALRRPRTGSSSYPSSSIRRNQT